MESMNRGPVRLLTVSREYGAGGSELGALLGRELGWRVLDHELVGQLAARCDCAESEVRALSEHAPTLLERLAAAVTAPEAPTYPPPWAADPDRLAAAAREALLEASRTPPLIVVGHGSNCLFAGRPDVLRVRVTAPFDVRVQRVAKRTGASPAQAVDDVRRRDTDRQQYLRRYYQCDVNDPYAYDLQVNTGTVPLRMATQLVLAVIRDIDDH
jgi:hypothetical protein